MTESVEVQIKRLRMRSMRRGIKEMDLILQAFAEAHLEQMNARELALYDRLLSENDHDIYAWIGGQVSVPAHYIELIGQITKQAHGVTRPS